MKTFMRPWFILYILAIVSIVYIVVINSTRKDTKLALMTKELSYCNERKTPKGAIIKLDDGEKVAIIGNGSFELKSNTVAIIEYVY